jgi:hypothetical protein
MCVQYKYSPYAIHKIGWAACQSIISSNTQRKRFGMIVLKVTLKRVASPSYWLVPSASVRRCHPTLWHKVKITPLHKKGPITSPQNYRLLAINGCIYRLFANVVRDLLMDCALAEQQIPDSQFGFCPTRNTNQPLFILRHILAAAKKKKMVLS